MRRRPSAFTLIEILVVLGIIIMLAGLLFPLIGRAKEAGKRAQCLNNLRSLTQAWIAYAADNNRHLVFGGMDASGWLNKTPDLQHLGPIKRGKLYPYLNSTDPYRCPDDGSDLNFNPCSYAINNQLNGGVPSTPTRIDDIQAPVRTFAFIEQASTGQVINNVFATPVYPGIPILSSWPGENHHGAKAYAEGTGISFADGHAIFWTYSDTRTGNLREAAAAHLGTLDTNSPDVFQLKAWSGGPPPPDPPKLYDPTQPWP